MTEAQREQRRYALAISGGVCEVCGRPLADGQPQGAQNHHLNGHIMQICNETGNDYDSVKDAIKMFAVENMGYPYREIAGQIVPTRERASSTDECAKLIEAAHVLAAELSIILQE